MHRIIITVLAVIMSATANAQIVERPHPCDPLPPDDLIQRGIKLEQHDLWRFEASAGDQYHAEIRQVTGGVVLNWIGGTPSWAMRPEPDAFYAWEVGYGAYCRHFSEGLDLTAQSECRTDCLTALDGEFHYRGLKWMKWLDQWNVTAAAELVVR